MRVKIQLDKKDTFFQKDKNQKKLWKYEIIRNYKYL